MELTKSIQNADSLAAELNWLEKIIAARIRLTFNEGETDTLHEILIPESCDSTVSSIHQYYNMGFAERLLVVLALSPTVKPNSLDLFLLRNDKTERVHTEFGGIKNGNHCGFLPTIETALYLLAGENLALRFQYMELFSENHYLRKHNILQVTLPSSDEPFTNSALSISKEYVSFFSSGADYQPAFSPNFPAKKITTALNWEDLVVSPEVLEDLEEIKTWIEHHQTILETWQLSKNIKPGYRSLFYGPPGTGKTLAVTLLGKATGLDIYKVDLSMIVSKYIGETEKNLASIFDQALHKKWILFFDEADALFGKRTNATSSNDRHANQEIAYLLQRIEDFPGTIILSSNLAGNIDEAFARRFQSMVYFSMPDTKLRLQLWKNLFSSGPTLTSSINFKSLAEKHELAGGSMINILRYCALKAVNRSPQQILEEDIVGGIKRELRKEGKTI